MIVCEVALIICWRLGRSVCECVFVPALSVIYTETLAERGEREKREERRARGESGKKRRERERERDQTA